MTKLCCFNQDTHISQRPERCLQRQYVGGSAKEPVCKLCWW